jgi:hypothetical protein
MRRHLSILIGLIGLVLLLAFSFGLGKAQEANPAGERSGSPQEPVASSNLIPIQGRLADASGNPLTGNFDLTFRLYAAASGGAALCTASSLNVPVSQGLFNTTMNMGACGRSMAGSFFWACRWNQISR